MKGASFVAPLFGTLAHGLFGGTRTTTYTWTNAQQTVTAIQGGEYGNSILLGQGTSSVYASYGEVTTYYSKTLSVGTNGSVAVVSTWPEGYVVSSSTPASISVPLGTGSSSEVIVEPTPTSSEYIPPPPPSSSSVYVAPTTNSSSIVAYIPTSSSTVPLGTGYSSSTSSSAYVPPQESGSASVPIGTGVTTSSSSLYLPPPISGSSSVPLGTGSQPAGSPSSSYGASQSHSVPVDAGNMTSSSSQPLPSSGSSSSVPLGTGNSGSFSSSLPTAGSPSSSYDISPSSGAGNSSFVPSTSNTLSKSSQSISESQSGSSSGASQSSSASGSHSTSALSSSSLPVATSSSAVAGGYPVVITVPTTINGQSTDVPVISGGSVTEPIAITPTTTYAPEEVTSSKTAVESQLSSVFPLIQGWLDDTDSDPEPVVQNLEDIEDDVTNMLNGLEEDDGDDDGGCTSSLFSIFTCIIGDVTAIKGGITGTITGSVITSIQGTLTDLTDLTNQIQDVQDNNDNDDNDDDDDDDDDDESSSQSSASSTSSASCSASAVAHTQVTCSPSPISQSGTVASYTQVCETATEMITKCSASASASTTTLSTSSSSAPAASITGDFMGEQGPDLSEEIYSEIDIGMGCITDFQLPLPTACPGMGGGSDSQNSASSTSSVSSSTTDSSSEPTTTDGTTSASAGSSSSLSVPSSTGGSGDATSSAPSSSSPTTTSAATTAPPITSCELVTQPLTTIYSQEYPETIACECNDGWTAGIGTMVDDDGVTTYTCQVGTTTTMAVSTTTPPPPPPPYETGTCNVHVFEASLGEDLELFVQLNLTDGGGNLLSSTNYEAEWGDTMTLSGDDTKLPWDVVVDFTKSTQLSRRLRKRGVSKRELFESLRRDPDYAEIMRRDPEMAEILRRDPMACIAKRSPIPQGCGGAGSSPPDPYQKFEVSLSAGDSSWSTEDTDDESTPYCSVGGWDNGSFGDFLDEVFSLGMDQKVPTRQMDCYFPC